MSANPGRASRDPHGESRAGTPLDESRIQAVEQASGCTIQSGSGLNGIKTVSDSSPGPFANHCSRELDSWRTGDENASHWAGTALSDA